jgi:hypothetical protein
MHERAVWVQDYKTEISGSSFHILGLLSPLLKYSFPSLFNIIAILFPLVALHSYRSLLEQATQRSATYVEQLEQRDQEIDNLNSELHRLEERATEENLHEEDIRKVVAERDELQMVRRTLEKNLEESRKQNIDLEEELKKFKEREKKGNKTWGDWLNEWVQYFRSKLLGGNLHG